jgi:uncharacterized OB-fold protein
MTTKSEQPPLANEAGACEHCGALVYGDSVRCTQCGKFPIKLHRCPKCGSIASQNEQRCWKCRRPFEPGGDFF